jgi:thymidylate synthase ThyX
MDSREYKPDFPGEEWSENDLYYLEPFATNPQGLISVLTNLPPELSGALCSRASRAQGSLLRVLLKEYLRPIIDGEDKGLAAELEATIKFLRDHGFKKIVNNQRAQAFYAKWLSQYGDDSIAQLTGTHVVFWGISQVAMKFLEDRRIGLEPIEKSTRYVNFGEPVDGKYLYYAPKPDLEKLALQAEYKETLDHLFETYKALLPPLLSWLKQNFNDKESVLEKKAFDTLRGLLPMATLGQVAFRGNAQAFEYLLNRTAKHSLGELRWIASELKGELDKEIPSLLLRLGDEKTSNYQTELAERGSRTRDSLHKDWSEVELSAKPTVRLVEYDADALDKIVAGIIFPETHLGWESVSEKIKKMSQGEKLDLIKTYLGNRTGRWQKVGRAFENSYLRFEIEMNIGAYRDLHRHRMMTQERQLFSAHHGYDLPSELVESGLASQFESALHRAKELFDKIATSDPELAQYVVPLAYRMRFYEWQNWRQFFWEVELRTISQGHPDYRYIEHEKYRLVKEKFPELADFVLIDQNDYKIARRGTEEAIEKKEQKIIEKLKEKGSGGV